MMIKNSPQITQINTALLIILNLHKSLKSVVKLN